MSYRVRSASGRRQMRCIMVGTAYIQSAPCLSMRARAPAASKRGMITRWLPFSSARTAVVKGPLW